MSFPYSQKNIFGEKLMCANERLLCTGAEGSCYEYVSEVITQLLQLSFTQQSACQPFKCITASI